MFTQHVKNLVHNVIKNKHNNRVSSLPKTVPAFHIWYKFYKYWQQRRKQTQNRKVTTHAVYVYLNTERTDKTLKCYKLQEVINSAEHLSTNDVNYTYWGNSVFSFFIRQNTALIYKKTIQNEFEKIEWFPSNECTL